ncbi:MAG: ABC transporter ATP-binding protein [Candidatus Sumerlaeota bacterium]
MTEAKIECKNLTVKLGGKTPLEHFDLEVKDGERVTLTGRSGSGKTTVLRTILGFVQPENGEIRIADEKLDAYSVWNLRVKMAYVAQEPQLGRGTVRDVLERPFHYRANHDLRENLARVEALAEKFMLEKDRLDQKIEDLSGGEKQRIAIIAALLLDREILLLDEASSALDSESKAAVADYLRNDDSLTILSVSHDEKGFDISGRSTRLGGGGGRE